MVSSRTDSRGCQGGDGTAVSIGLVGMEIMLELRRRVLVFVRWDAVRIRMLGMDGNEGVRGVVGVMGVVGSLVDITLNEDMICFQVQVCLWMWPRLLCLRVCWHCREPHKMIQSRMRSMKSVKKTPAAST